MRKNPPSSRSYSLKLYHRTGLTKAERTVLAAKVGLRPSDLRSVAAVDRAIREALRRQRISKALKRRPPRPPKAPPKPPEAPPKPPKARELVVLDVEPPDGTPAFQLPHNIVGQQLVAAIEDLGGADIDLDVFVFDTEAFIVYGPETVELRIMLPIGDLDHFWTFALTHIKIAKINLTRDIPKKRGSPFFTGVSRIVARSLP